MSSVEIMHANGSNGDDHYNIQLYDVVLAPPPVLYGLVVYMKISENIRKEPIVIHSNFMAALETACKNIPS